MFRALFVFVLLTLALAGPATAQIPPLQVPEDQLAAALKCEGRGAQVLLVPGTGETPSFFAWNYIPALRKTATPFCTVELPENATADIQVAAEYVVWAIRAMFGARGGERISLIGHSQGGMLPRWALKWWPDTRVMVDDLIGLASSNHGTTAARNVCNPQCNAAAWQQRDDSKFIAALNAGAETWAGISYTTVYSHNDEIVTPNADEATGSTPLRTGEGARVNVAIQDLCPLDSSEHLALGSYDAVGYALARDALANPGPADPKRIPATVCTQPFHEGVNAVTFAADSSTSFAAVVAGFAGGKTYPEEPPPACYVTDSCPREVFEPPLLAVSVKPRAVRAGRQVRVRVVVRDESGEPVQGARVRLGGRSARSAASGRATLKVRFRSAGKQTIRVSRAGYAPARATLRVRR